MISSSFLLKKIPNSRPKLVSLLFSSSSSSYSFRLRQKCYFSYTTAIFQKMRRTTATLSSNDSISNNELLVQKLLQEAKKRLKEKRQQNSSLWQILQNDLLQPSMSFEVHQSCYESVYNTTTQYNGPAWIPPCNNESNNIKETMKEKGFQTYSQLYNWSVTSYDEFWMESSQKIGIVWKEQPSSAFDLSDGGPSQPIYFPNGKLNIADSCFQNMNQRKDTAAIVYNTTTGKLRRRTYEELHRLSNRIAASLISSKLKSGEGVALCMPMTPECIACYLGIIKAGCVVVSIADSFSASEIATRCYLGNAKLILTQDMIYNTNKKKTIPLFHRVKEANTELMLRQQQESNTDISEGMKIVVLPGSLHNNNEEEDAVLDEWNSDHLPMNEKKDDMIEGSVRQTMRPQLDFGWYEFLNFANSNSSEEEVSSSNNISVPRNSMDPCNILFSSGTTGEPKAIVWSHSTPIKCAVDGYYHQNLGGGKVAVWPTNIGWMMGPWLVYQMIHGTTIGLFLNGPPSSQEFCQFASDAKVTMLGVIPSIVKAWRASYDDNDHKFDVDWNNIETFSSTGEASDPKDMLWLMSRVKGYAPVIEYCGGTEIGGSFLSSTVVQPNVPSMFSTPVLGSRIILVDPENDGRPFDNNNHDVISGEITLVPPSIGLSTRLLNRDHYDTYFRNMKRGPQNEILRRHGDEMECVKLLLRDDDDTNDKYDYYYRALGRCDDTMNLGGIKVGSAEIERVCNTTTTNSNGTIIHETAAIAIHNPSKLVIFCVLKNNNDTTTTTILREMMQKSITTQLNPLFKIHDVVLRHSLPRTASNKVMRRLLRDEYYKKNSQK